MLLPSAKLNSAVTLKVAEPSKAPISRSRSTSSRTAGDCTRPADLPPGTFCQTTGDSSNPTKRSRICRACWALTRLISTVRGCLMAFSIASLVISWKTMRLVFVGSSFNTSHKCQAIASPSRSSSVASQTVPASFAALRSSATVFFFSESTSYTVSKFLAVSIGGVPPLTFLAILRMCPTLDSTLKSRPRYFSIVLPLAGDSTITKFLLMLTQVYLYK